MILIVWTLYDLQLVHISTITNNIKYQTITICILCYLPSVEAGREGIQALICLYEWRYVSATTRPLVDRASNPPDVR